MQIPPAPSGSWSHPGSENTTHILSSGRILGWGKTCLTSSLRASPSIGGMFSRPVRGSLGVVRPEGGFQQGKGYFLSFKPLQGATILWCSLYSLSAPKKEAMQHYLDEALAAGLIHTSSSPEGASFLFVGRKDWGLKPCIDFIHC